MKQIAFFEEQTYDSPPALALTSLPLRERPTYRVTEAGADACGLAELLAAIVGGAQQLEIAYGLLGQFDGLIGMARASVHQLEQQNGVGHATAARIKAALEFGRRMTLATAGDRPQVRSPADVAAVLMTKMGCLEQEHFVVVILNTRNRVLDTITLYVGSLNASHVRVGEMFREAIRRNAAAAMRASSSPTTTPPATPHPRPRTSASPGASWKPGTISTSTSSTTSSSATPATSACASAGWGSPDGRGGLTMPTPCYFCGQPLAAGEEIERHHPDRDQFPNWTEPAHAECHARYHSEAGHFTKWGGWSAYKGRPGYERTIARWPGWHRMGGLARARSATRDERGRFE